MTDPHLLRLPAPPLVLPVVVLGLAVAGGLVARGGNVLPGDRQATSTIQSLDGRGYAWLADIGNVLGTSAYAVAVVVFLIAGFAVRRELGPIVFLVALVVLRSAGAGLKGLFDSNRPAGPGIEFVGRFDGYGYPSGHAMTAAVALGGIAVLVHAFDAPAAVRWITWVLAAAGILVTSFARVWVGAHWTTDTIGGTLFGLAIITFALVIADMVLRQGNHRPR